MPAKTLKLKRREKKPKKTASQGWEEAANFKCKVGETRGPASFDGGTSNIPREERQRGQRPRSQMFWGNRRTKKILLLGKTHGGRGNPRNEKCDLGRIPIVTEKLSKAEERGLKRGGNHRKEKKRLFIEAIKEKLTGTWGRSLTGGKKKRQFPERPIVLPEERTITDQNKPTPEKDKKEKPKSTQNTTVNELVGKRDNPRLGKTRLFSPKERKEKKKGKGKSRGTNPRYTRVAERPEGRNGAPPPLPPQTFTDAPGKNGKRT